MMQLAHEMKKRRMLLRAQWLPRDENQEADDLTNMEFRHFDPAKQIKVNLDDLGFELMDSLFAEGDKYIEALDLARANEKRKAEARTTRESQRDRKEAKKRPKLKETDPWDLEAPLNRPD